VAATEEIEVATEVTEEDTEVAEEEVAEEALVVK